MSRKLAFSIFGALAAIAAAGSALVFAPFETVTALRKAALWKGGVRRVRLEGGLLAYEKDGCQTGKPCRCVALIHGLGDSAMTWDHILLDKRASTQGLLLLAPDMPGTDGSAAPAVPSGYAIRAQARTLRAALAGVCPAWTVAGNSLGGWTALWLALDWPEGVKNLVLLDAAGLSDPSGREEESARALADPTPAALKRFNRRSRDRQRDIPERAWIAAAAVIRGRHTYDIVHALDRGEFLDGRLASLKLPVRIVWGASDGIIPIEVGRRMHRLIAGSRYEIVQRCGHLPQQECPEPVARAVFDSAPR